MLTFGFFTAVFLSLSWLFYIGMQIYAELKSATLVLEITDLLFVFIPLLTIWIIWCAFYRFYSDSHHRRQFLMLEAQLRQSQSFLELMTRLIYQEQKTQNGCFVLNQTEFLIGEMNGLIADILHRYNFISESEYERLWNSQNKWGFAKALITLDTANSAFKDRLFKTAMQESMLKGTINEFCARYASLIDILKKYDHEKIYLNIIETGVLGKAFAILAPLADKIKEEIEKENKQLSFFESEDALSYKPLLDTILSEQNFDDGNVTPQALNSTESENISQSETAITQEKSETVEKEETFPDILEELKDLKTPEEIMSEEDIENKTEEKQSAELEADKDLPKALFETDENSVEEISKNPDTEASSEKADTEISSMFDGAGIRGEDDEEENRSFFPKIGHLFKKRESTKKYNFTQDEIDPLTLALERSFGKLSENSPTSTSRLDKVWKEQKDTEEQKFGFTGTNKTIIKLQKELEKLHNTNNPDEKKD